MGKHQIIYTSCMRGINSVNDGQQVFSYDANFPDYKRDDVKSLFTYQHPALDIGVVMSEALALTMPQAFIYRRLDNKMFTLTLNTYLGRDYMGDTGRFGNHLSHSIICDEAELSHYPCEFYGSGMLRSNMNYGEVNNSERPDYLPTPELIKGHVINVEAITEFLSVGNRLEIYKMMLAAMLAYDSERKRLVICDESANIIKWIAALEYALPLRNAANIDFTTYEYDPALSISRVCGVVPQGTRFTSSNSQQHFVFNMFEQQFPEVVLVDSEFFEFIDMSMSFSYDSLQAFHEFLNASYHYPDADMHYYDAYQLYELRIDGMRGISSEEFERATAFALKYAQKHELIALVEQLATDRDIILHLNHAYSIAVFTFILASYDQISITMQDAVRELVAERIIMNFVSDASDEASFTQFYRDIDGLCLARNFSVAVELMKDENGKKLFNVMQQGVAKWKTVFIVKVLCDYVKRNNVLEDELLVEGEIGNVFYDIIKGAYLDQATNGIYIANYILDEFAEHYVYLMNMMFNIEGMLIELTDGEAASDLIWRHFANLAISHQKHKCLAISKFFGSYERYERVYEIYASLLESCQSAEEGRKIYEQHLSVFCLKNSKYASAYLPDVLSIYYKHMRKYQDEHTPKTEAEVLTIMVDNELQLAFADELIKSVLNRISLESPKGQTYELVKLIFDYNYRIREQMIAGKLLFLAVGILIEENLKSFATTQLHIQEITKGKQIDLTSLGIKSSKSYFTWILPHICRSCLTADEMFEICNLFRMTDEDLTDYVLFCSKHYLQASKDKKGYELFCQFLKFLFKVDHADLQAAVGKQLSKLRNNDLEQLNDAVLEFFQGDRKENLFWEEIYEVAESTNPLLNNITNFFKRK
ncbi:MAG TPA: hypothetical protein IAA29_10910 [Candidatus Paenibacillus intestinavium]|nr:hypothetical protein [Candidatus Paenibacillus intestinavium]